MGPGPPAPLQKEINKEKIVDLVVVFGGIFRNKRLGRVRALVDRLFPD